MHFQWMQIYATNPLDFDKQLLNINLFLFVSKESSIFEIQVACSLVKCRYPKKKDKTFKAATSLDCILSTNMKDCE